MNSTFFKMFFLTLAGLFSLSTEGVATFSIIEDASQSTEQVLEDYQLLNPIGANFKTRTLKNKNSGNDLFKINACDIASSDVDSTTNTGLVAYVVYSGARRGRIVLRTASLDARGVYEKEIDDCYFNQDGSVDKVSLKNTGVNKYCLAYIDSQKKLKIRHIDITDQKGADLIKVWSVKLQNSYPDVVKIKTGISPQENFLVALETRTGAIKVIRTKHSKVLSENTIESASSKLVGIAGTGKNACVTVYEKNSTLVYKKQSSATATYGSAVTISDSDVKTETGKLDVNGQGEVAAAYVGTSDDVKVITDFTGDASIRMLTDPGQNISSLVNFVIDEVLNSLGTILTKAGSLKTYTLSNDTSTSKKVATISNGKKYYITSASQYKPKYDPTDLQPALGTGFNTIFNFEENGRKVTRAAEQGPSEDATYLDGRITCSKEIQTKLGAAADLRQDFIVIRGNCSCVSKVLYVLDEDGKIRVAVVAQIVGL